VSARRDDPPYLSAAVEDSYVLTMLDQTFGHIASDGTLPPDQPRPDGHAAARKAPTPQDQLTA
jgi:hypothetical protein